MNVKNILLAFLVQMVFSLPLFAADPVLLNCIETPEIYDLDARPKNFSSSNNLRRKPGSPNSATGELIHIVGRIADINCLPIQNAVVSIWHANSRGVNHYDKNIEDDPNFAGSGRFVVNNLGYYNFITIAPGKIGDRAPHINFLVQHPDFPEFTTQMFFADHNCDNCADPVLEDFVSNGLASLLITPFTYSDQVIKTYTFNITLGGYNKFSNKSLQLFAMETPAMKITISKISSDFKTIVMGLFEDNETVNDGGVLQGKQIIDNIKQFSDFNGSFGEFFSTILPEEKNVIVVGLGKKDEWNENKELNIGGKIYCELSRLKIKKAAILIEGSAANVAYGAFLRSFKFDKYKTKKDEKITEVEEITVLVKDEQLSNAERSFEHLRQEGESIFLARSFITEPPNILYPESYADHIKKELTKLSLEIEVLDKKQMEEKKMGALLGVAQGSSKEPKLVVIKWNGASKEQKPIAFVGKGITFDTGGVSLKPSRGMESMKYDMAGSAAVVGVMHALAGRKAKVNAIGVVALAENAVGGNAQRPSDVVTSMSGQTIEVLNTDAEGRLILADALWYTQERFSPQFMIDLATLTGAIVVALGNNEYAGLFSNNNELADRLIDAGNEVNEKLWRFPMNETYDKIIDSPIADVQNIAPAGSGGDSIMAAQFLQRFVNETCWAHLDIAGTAWHEKGTDICPRGAVGFGVRLLNKLVEKYYEAND